MEILNLKGNPIKYKNVIDTDKTYWFEMIGHGHEVYTLVDRIPKVVIDFIKQGQIYLLLSNEFECFTIVPELILTELVLKHNIPEHKILFISGAKDISVIVKELVQKVNSDKKVNLVGFPTKFYNWFEYNIANSCKMTRHKFDIQRNLCLTGKGIYQKHFLLLNRRWRIHRPTLIGLLESKNLLQQGYVSLSTDDGNSNWQNKFADCLEVNKNNKQVFESLLENKEKICSLPNLELDNVGFEGKIPNLVSSMNNYYITSFMSVVTETYFYDWSTLFLSEKTFKPIAYKHPFILVSVPHSLQFLQELGYKTFHPLIDESYDIEKNDGQRMLMIVKEIEKICKLNQKELQEFSLEFKDICNHNQKKLLSYSI